MSRSRILDYLPEVYHRLLPDFFTEPLHEERHATCSSCAMCAPSDGADTAETYFSPSTKCCTYHPDLPNFLVGGLLRDESDAGREGRRRIEEKIARRVGVTPFGIAAPPRLRFLFVHGKAGFGQAESLMCPYLDAEAGGCTVWAHREAECATWFCKHNSGLDGRVFWFTLRLYLFETQRVLTQHVLRELGFDAAWILAGVEDPKTLDANALDDRPLPDAEYAALWGEWAGREAALYLEAARLVDTLDRATFDRLAGLDHQLRLGSLADRHRVVMHPVLPDRLVRNPMMRIDTAPDGSCVLTTYSRFDPTRLQKHVFDLLELFDGRTATGEVRARIEARTGLRVADSFLIRLCQQRILIDPTQAQSAAPVP